MAAGAEGHGEAGNGLDIIGHILDNSALHIGPFHIPLPAIHLFGCQFQFTVHMLMMWIAALFLVVALILSTRRRGLVPSGFANMVEALVLFVRDELAVPNIGKKEANKFLPFLLTIFFFILTCNLMGLIPGAATATANINVTAALAICSFVAITLGGIWHNGLFGYFKGLIPHGLPMWLLPIMVPIEFIGLFTKPFALCVRLFANMTAGHVVILSLLGLIFVLQTYFVAPVAIAFTLAIYMLEIFVGLIQAYVFTLLSSLFIGMAVHQEH